MRSKMLFAPILFLTLAGCKFEGGIFDPNAADKVVSENDFLKSFMQGNPRGVADGSTILDVVVFYKNSDDSAVVGFTPTFSATMSGLTSLGCSVSDTTGKSVCRFTSVLSGSFVLAVTNIGWNLEATINFDPSFKSSVRGFASSGSHSLTGPGGWKSSGSVGSVTSKAILTGSGGWKAYIDTQPMVGSQ